MKLSDAYRDRDLWFRDEYDRETGERVVYAMKNGMTGEGRAPWPTPPDCNGLVAIQRAVDDLERKLA